MQKKSGTVIIIDAISEYSFSTDYERFKFDNMAGFLTKICKLLFLAFFLLSCNRNEKVKIMGEIPSALRGEWVNELGEQKLTIEQGRIIYSGIIESEYDTLVKTPREIYYFKRSKCQDCFEFGVATHYWTFLIQSSLRGFNKAMTWIKNRVKEKQIAVKFANPSLKIEISKVFEPSL